MAHDLVTYLIKSNNLGHDNSPAACHWPVMEAMPFVTLLLLMHRPRHSLVTRTKVVVQSAFLDFPNRNGALDLLQIVIILSPMARKAIPPTSEATNWLCHVPASFPNFLDSYRQGTRTYSSELARRGPSTFFSERKLPHLEQWLGEDPRSLSRTRDELQ